MDSFWHRTVNKLLTTGDYPNCILDPNLPDHAYTVACFDPSELCALLSVVNDQ